MSKIGLSANTVGAEETKNVLNGIKVQTAPVHVGNASHEENTGDDAINMTLGVFFDGTGNNRENTESRELYEEKTDKKNPKILDATENEKAKKYLTTSKDGTTTKKTGSYSNAYSNVARLERFYNDVNKENNYFEKVYIEGIGTTNAMEDDTTGLATGTGITGIRAKVKKGCKQCADKIDYPKIKNINQLTIDVFGFSRGAAAARNFLHEIHKKKGEHKEYKTVPVTTSAGVSYVRHSVKYTTNGGILGELLVKRNIKVKNATIRFAGLFDTVASHGIRQNNDVKDLGLDAVSHAKYAFHLASADEHRFKFSLTTINSAIKKGTGIEKFLPGVHSDIGGSYEQNENELILLNYIPNIKEDWYSKRFWKDYRYLVEQGYFIDKKEIKVHDINFSLYDVTGNLVLDLVKVKKVLMGTRANLSNKYSYIPLTFMADELVCKNIFTQQQLTQLKSKFDFSDDPILVAAEERLREYVFKGGKKLDFYGNEEDRKILLSLRNKYLHFSSQYIKDLNTIGMLPEWVGDRRARSIYSDLDKREKAEPTVVSLQYDIQGEYELLKKKALERREKEMRRHQSKENDAISKVKEIKPLEFPKK